jgi:Ca2+:H+ antiporter
VVVLGLSAANMLLLTLTVALNTLIFSGTHATMPEGAVPLTLFAFS